MSINPENNAFLLQLKSAIKSYTKFLIKNVDTVYKETDFVTGEIMNFYNDYLCLSYAMTLLYYNAFFPCPKKDFIEQVQKFNLPWFKISNKLSSAIFILMNLLKNINGLYFYEKYTESILKKDTRCTNEKSNYSEWEIFRLTVWLNQDERIEILNENEIAQLLMIIIYEPMVNYVNTKKNHLNDIFASYSQEELKEKWYDIDYFSKKLIISVAENQDFYTDDFDKRDYIKTKSIKMSNHDCKKNYKGLRENILIIFKRQKNVNFYIQAYSPWMDAMFVEPNINFKECIKLIIKNENWTDFVKDIKNKSEFMVLNNWSSKFNAHIGNLILMQINGKI